MSQIGKIPIKSMGMKIRKSNIVKVGSLCLGGDNPPLIQTMGKLPLTQKNLGQIISELKELKIMGCNIIRFAIPDEASISAFQAVAKENIMPLVADIHFDHKLALLAIKAGANKIRINPGNIGADWKVKEVVNACKDRGIPIRIGVNGGSLPLKFKGLNRIDAMVKSGCEEIELLESLDFHDIVLSLKASNMEETIAANREIAKLNSYPIHIGITEAGPLISSLVKSSIAFYNLLSEGVGDTIRVSISDKSEYEVIAAREILKACGLSKKGVTIVSCPKCGRALFDQENGFINELQNYLYAIDKDITVAVMGCIVNGPGEAKDADIGITGNGKEVMLFKKGKLIKRVSPINAINELKQEIELL